MMIQRTFIHLCVEYLLCLTVFVQCQLSPDLGPLEPSFETCETMDCPENSNCMDDYGYVSCICIKGKTGVNCTLDDPCMERLVDCPAGSTCFGDCRPNVICEGATGIAHCRGCVAGWTGLYCEEDVDECSDSINPCSNGAECINTVGEFKCMCKTGWTGKMCECQKGTACDIEESKTDETKGNLATHITSSAALLLVALILSAL